MPTQAQLEAIFAEWDRRAEAGNWDANPRHPAESARIFNEIAIELFPDLKRGDE